MTLAQRAIGAPIDRVDGPAKVTGAAKYAFEQAVDAVAYAAALQSTIGRGRIRAVDAGAALALDGVVAVIWHENAPRVLADDPEIAVLQSDAVAFRGQFVAVVVADTPEVARHAAGLVRVDYDEQPHDVELSADRDDLYAPDADDADSERGDVDAAVAAAEVVVDRVYTTPVEHNHPLEPHATVASWDGDSLTLHDANQGPYQVRDDIAGAFGIHPERVRVISPYVGGAFGSKFHTHAHVVLAAMAARAADRPVKLELTREQMFTAVGYRSPTIQRVRLGAGPDGRLSAIAHDVVLGVAAVKDKTEEMAARATRVMYAAPNRRTTHRLAALDLPPSVIMRAPGECPGMFALESAVDELAVACGVDPIELRLRNEPDTDPESGLPFSSRGLVGCLREGALRFGWQDRDPAPGTRRDGRCLVGTGVAAATYPARGGQANATIRADPADQRYRVSIAACDIGTGAWTALTQIAADALEVPIERVTVEIGDTALPRARSAGGSRGTAAWGSAIVHAARKLREHGGREATADAGENPHSDEFSMHSFGAHFAEVRVDVATGEVRVPRLLGVFAVGRVINPKTARSQLVGAMTMGLSMALHEESVLDPRFGDFANHDLGDYHVAVNADVRELDAICIDEDDPYVNPMGAKGVGELGIVGTAAAIANAVHHATGVRVRDLPIRLDDLLGHTIAG